MVSSPGASASVPWRLALQRHEELLRYWRSPIARKHMGDVMRARGDNTGPLDWVDEFVADEAGWVQAAQTWALASDMGELLAHAAVSMPAESVERSDPPAPNAFVLLEEPLAFGDSDTRLRALHWYATENAVVATGYFIYDDNARLTPVTRLVWRYGDTSWTPSADHREVARFLKALWTISQQTIAKTESVSDRASRRDGRRRGLPDEGSVRVITLRHARRPVPEEQQVREVDWQRRWIVSGHWRNQYLPGSGTHRLQWIAPHLKGPADKPLVLRDEVVYLRR